MSLTGIRSTDLAWALASGEVAFSTTRAGDEGMPMIALEDVQRWLKRLAEVPPEALL